MRLVRFPFSVLLERLARDNRGNVAAMFAFLLPVLLAAAGVAIDYSRAASARSAMQAAVDAAALMISKEAANLSASQITTKANAYFAALFNHPEVGSVSFNASYTPNSGNGASVVINAAGTMQTDFMKLAGFPTVPLNVSSTTKWGNMRYRVALALDNTGSMAEADKMNQLKLATKQLINDFYNMAGGNDDIYISIVPFSKDVNLDPANVNATWIRWTEWEAEPQVMATWLANAANRAAWEQVGPGDPCPFTNGTHGFRCAPSPTSTQTTPTVPSFGSWNGYICPGTDSGNLAATRGDIQYNGCYASVAASRTIDSGSGASCDGAVSCSCSGGGRNRVCTQQYVAHPWVKNARATWNGCVMDRDQDFDINSAVPSSATPASMAPAEQYSLCPTPMLGMTSVKQSKQTLIGKVDAMYPAGNTNQAIGLAWAWQTHFTSGVFAAPAKDANYAYIDVIILLTDGENTMSRWSSSRSAIDTREASLCSNIKATGMKLFAVQVATDGDAQSSMLKTCTSDPTNPNYFSYITQASQMTVKFQNIFKELARLRVAA